MSDYQLNDTVHLLFTTRQFSDGVPTALSGGVIDIYEDVTATPIVTGETLVASLNSVVGLNAITVTATSGTGFNADGTYHAVLQAGTVGGVSVVGEVVGTFTIEKDCTNWAKVAAPTTAVDLSATDFQLVDTAVNLTTNNDKTGYALSSTGLDAIVAAADGMVQIAKAVWDRVLTGATHAIADSGGRRLRDLQEFGTYEGGAVWIDTILGSAGTTDFESGTDINEVDSITDANTLAASVGLSRFKVAPMSSITFAASQENQQFEGKNWDLALGSQSISNSYISGADVTGTGTSTVEVHFDHCEMGTCTLGAAHLDDCDLSGTVTLSAAADYFFINCVHAGGTATIDFGVGVLNTTVHVHGYRGALTIANMGQMGIDILHFDSPGGSLTLAASCVGGTVNMNGTFNFINNGSGMTINDDGAIIETVGTPAGADVSTDIAAVKAETVLIVADTNELQLDWQNTGRLDNILDARMAEASIGTTGGAVDTVTTLTGHTAQTGDSFTRIGAAGVSLTNLGGMSTAMKAEVLVEVNAALDAAISELSQGVPTATPSIRTGIMLMYMALRNKLDVQTSGTDALEVHSDDGTQIAIKLLSDDGSDFSEAKMTTGV